MVLAAAAVVVVLGRHHLILHKKTPFTGLSEQHAEHDAENPCTLQSPEKCKLLTSYLRPSNSLTLAVWSPRPRSSPSDLQSLATALTYIWLEFFAWHGFESAWVGSGCGGLLHFRAQGCLERLKHFGPRKNIAGFGFQGLLLPVSLGRNGKI